MSREFSFRIEIQRASRQELFRWRVLNLQFDGAVERIRQAIYAETSKEARRLKRLMTTSCVTSDREIVACWCGARGTVGELFSADSADEHCGGFGSVDCNCGGDGCVCHNHGEIECFGCSDCADDEEELGETDQDFDEVADVGEDCP